LKLILEGKQLPGVSYRKKGDSDGVQQVLKRSRAERRGSHRANLHRITFQNITTAQGSFGCPVPLLQNFLFRDAGIAGVSGEFFHSRAS